MQHADNLTTLFSALADPTRRAILARLTEREATLKELAAPFKVSLQAVSRHLSVLETAGLIRRGREAQWRPCRLRAEPLEALDHWLERYRLFWEDSFDKMDAYLAEISKGGAHARKRRKSKAGR